MSNQLETLIVERDEGVVTVTMNRPARKNAANGTMWHELLATFEDVATDREARVMILTGAGDAFCRGPTSVTPRMWPGGRAIRFPSAAGVGDVALRLHRIPKPTIAKVGGVAAGAGMSMALGCDLVVASDTGPFLPDLRQTRALGGLRRLVAPAPVDRPAPGQGVRLLR